MSTFFVTCMVTVWMIHPATKKPAPFGVGAVCERSPTELFTVKTGAPETFFVDCSEDLSWLETDSPLRFMATAEQCGIEE